MLFSSPVFLYLFLPLLLLVYQLPGRRTKNLVLLAGSLVFYAWEERDYLLLLALSVVFNYGFGRWVERDLERGRRGRLPVALAVGFNVGLLVAFKYLGFLARSLGALLGQAGIAVAAVDEASILSSRLHLPVGISFFTFQAISFVVDTQRRQARVPANPLDFGLYLTSFPQLLAGPIVRFREVARQLEERSESWSLFATGVRRFTIGLAKKVLVADVLAVTVDRIYALDPGQVSAGGLWLGSVSFWGQIYFDFSGYSDMAIGLGCMFGFRFPENFRHPYAARSMSDFWRRWHITLSSWFLDYLYFPLIGRRPGRLRTYASLVFVLTLCGLWHGASWHFVLVGLLHGVLLAAERVGLAAQLERWPLALRVLYTNFWVLVGWVLFRSPDLAHTGATLRGMFGLGAADVPYHAGFWLEPMAALALVAAVLASAPWPWSGDARGSAPASGADRPAVRVAWQLTGLAGLFLLLIACFARIAAGSHQPFVYFRF